MGEYHYSMYMHTVSDTCHKYAHRYINALHSHSNSLLPNMSAPCIHAHLEINIGTSYTYPFHMDTDEQTIDMYITLIHSSSHITPNSQTSDIVTQIQIYSRNIMQNAHIHGCMPPIHVKMHTTESPTWTYSQILRHAVHIHREYKCTTYAKIDIHYIHKQRALNISQVHCCVYVIILYQ